MSTEPITKPVGGSGTRYEPITQIGRRGMAEVLLSVAQTGAGVRRLVVPKRIWPELATDRGFVTMFLDEAHLSLRLNHTNVVQTYEVLADHGELAIAMEYLDGQPLGGPQPPAPRTERAEPPAAAAHVEQRAGRPGARAHAGGLRRHGPRGRAPRRQPTERLRHLRRPGQARRLRRRQDAGRLAPHATGNAQGQARVHGARAAAT